VDKIDVVKEAGIIADFLAAARQSFAIKSVDVGVQITVASLVANHRAFAAAYAAGFYAVLIPHSMYLALFLSRNR
jgi:hypothetical protein